MQSIDHRNILKVYDVYENFRYLLYVTDLCATMNLKDEVQFHDYSEIESKNILKQIIMGVH